MTRPFTEADFSSQISEDRAWRLKEISDLKDAVIRSDERLSRVLLRALIAICYAHWEGSVRFAARKYLEHVSLRKYKYTQLDKQFFRNYFLPRLAALSITKTSIAERCALLDEVLTSSDKRYSHVNSELINTRANLNSEVFSDICLVCGISADFFVSERTFIDVVLLKRRNEIAHGEDTFVDVADLDEITTQTVSLMRSFGDQLENMVYVQGYKASA